jgi:carbon monoxide dehydrogenase subunit G
MQIENAFTVPAPADRLWSYLLDVERIAPCMPGAELTETVDDRTWKGKVHMKLGPVSLSFAGTVTMEERDDDAKRVVLKAKGMEAKGKGAANASVTSWLEPGDGETTVKMIADIQLTGTVAQLSRGLLPEVSKKLTAEFASCLQETMLSGESASAKGAVVEAAEAAVSGQAATGPAADTGGSPAAGAAGGRMSAAPRQAKAIGALRLGLSAIWAVIRNFFRRLFRRR